MVTSDVLNVYFIFLSINVSFVPHYLTNEEKKITSQKWDLDRRPPGKKCELDIAWLSLVEDGQRQASERDQLSRSY